MKKPFYFILIGLVCSMAIFSCIEMSNTFSKLPPGKWRAVLKLDGQPISLVNSKEEVEYKKEFDYKGELPFQFEVVYTSKEDFYVELINGEERITVKDIRYGRDKRTAKDTVLINFPVYDSYIQGIYEDGVIEGNWVVNYKDNYQIPFIAFHGQDHRFPSFAKSANVNLTGNWDVKFEPDTENEYPAVGEFAQKDNTIRGTFLTETGDYRYLDGIVYDNKAFMSCFDGSHAFLFEAKMLTDSSLVGTFRSGKHYTSNWIAHKSNKASLTDAFNLTKAENESAQLNFDFPNADGVPISLNDDIYKDKVKLVMIMGTWCPNCRDEMKFLLNYFAKNPNSDIELVAVGFERYKDEEKAMSVLKRYKEKMGIDFEVLYGGYASKKLASEKFPMLDKIISYPTLLFVDKNNLIRKIHTGFNGPATSKFTDFKKEFEEIITELVNE